MGMGGVPARDGVRLCLAMAAVTFALLVAAGLPLVRAAQATSLTS